MYNTAYIIYIPPHTFSQTCTHMAHKRMCTFHSPVMPVSVNRGFKMPSWYDKCYCSYSSQAVLAIQTISTLDLR